MSNFIVLIGIPLIVFIVSFVFAKKISDGYVASKWDILLFPSAIVAFISLFCLAVGIVTYCSCKTEFANHTKLITLQNQKEAIEHSIQNKSNNTLILLTSEISSFNEDIETGRYAMTRPFVKYFAYEMWYEIEPIDLSVLEKK